jgi:hypothetical protein
MPETGTDVNAPAAMLATILLATPMLPFHQQSFGGTEGPGAHDGVKA